MDEGVVGEQVNGVVRWFRPTEYDGTRGVGVGIASRISNDIGRNSVRRSGVDRECETKNRKELE
jgi:hypothetical protein